MRGMLALVVAMGVLIVAGVAVVAITIMHRMMPAPGLAPAQAVLAEPPGTHILAASATADRLTLTLQGGGPDRVAIIDLASGRKIGGVRLSQ